MKCGDDLQAKMKHLKRVLSVQRRITRENCRLRDLTWSDTLNYHGFDSQSQENDSSQRLYECDLVGAKLDLFTFIYFGPTFLISEFMPRLIDE